MRQNDYDSECGSISVICGPMFSGKTSELIKRLKKQKNKNYLVFKPEIDDRYEKDKIVSHDQKKLDAIKILESKEILNYIKKDQNIIVGIDEAQFFDKNLPKICNRIANMGNTVIVAGLNMDSDGCPFGPMPFLLAIAENITTLSSICVKTGKKAYYTKAIKSKKEQIKIGEKKSYVALCRKEFYKNEK